MRLIEPTGVGGGPVGVVIHSRKLWGSGELGVHLYEVKSGVPLLAVTPSVMRYLNAMGQECATRDGEDWAAISFNLGEHHPVYETVAERLTQTKMPYAWFLRVPDLPAFVRQIVPALEARLATSIQAGYTGELRVSLYRDGMKLVFLDGRISVERWHPDRVEAGDAAFPDLTFLQLLFGYRSLTELRHTFADCSVTSDAARALLPVLFPKMDSNVWSGG